MAASAKIRGLRQRWASPPYSDLAPLARRLLEGKLSQQYALSLGFQLHDGRLDLRGVSLAGTIASSSRVVAGPGVSRTEGALFGSGVSWDSIDLSFADMNGASLVDSAIRNTKFEGASLRGFRAWGTSFDTCEFLRTDLRGALLSGTSGSGAVCSFSNVSFLNALLSRAVLSDGTFESVLFIGTGLENINCRNGIFQNCVFKGKLSDVVFFNECGNNDALDRCDFSEADFKFVEFRNFDFTRSTRITWPVGDRYLVLSSFKRVLEAAITLMVGEQKHIRMARSTLSFLLKWCGPDQEIGLINFGDFEDDAEKAVLRDALTSAIRLSDASVLAGNTSLKSR